MSKKIRIFLVGCVLMAVCCIGLTVGASENAQAKVVAHNLTITDEGINVNFYVDVKGDVQATLNGIHVDIPEQTEKIIIDAKTYNCFKFTKPVVAKEMDKKISLVIKSGNDVIVEDNYCVNDYATSVIDDKYNYNYEELVKSMTYYGDFAETYLNYEANKADEGKAEEFLQQFDENAKEDLLSGKYALVRGENLDGITPAGIQLNLVSEVAIRLSFNVTDDKALDYEFTAVSGDITKNLGKLKKGNYNGTEYYYIDIENIGADALDKAFTIKVGDTSVLSNCSALSYARTAIKSTTASANLVNLAKALYLYNQKAKTYVSSQTTAVQDIFYNGTGFYADPACSEEIYLMSNDTEYADVTRDNSGDKITALSQLNNSRTKGCSVWMKVAYEVSGVEELAGPYVIRRYAANTGNVLNVTGKATFNTTVEGGKGEFAAKYPGGIDEFTIGNVTNGEVYVSGTLNVTGNARTGLVTTNSADVTINAEGLTVNGEVVFQNHTAQKLTGNGKASAIKLVDDGQGHFGAIETENGLILGSIICVCGMNVNEHKDLECAWTKTQKNGVQAIYEIEWQPWNATASVTLDSQYKRVGLPWVTGSYYLTEDLKNIKKYADIKSAIVVNLDLAGHSAQGVGGEDMIYRLDGGTLNILDSSEEKTGAIIATGESTTIPGRVIYIWGNNSNTSCVNFFGGKMSVAEGATGKDGVVVRILNGTFNMYGGEILPGTCATEDGSNCVTLGNGTKNTVLNVQGGTIRGEVKLNSSSAKLSIGKSAKVGVEETGKAYGIGTSSAVTTTVNITYDDVTEEGRVVLKSTDYLGLKEGSTGDERAFTILEVHNKVSDDSNDNGIGELSYAARMCVCGKTDGMFNHTANCTQPETAWIAWNKAASKAMHSNYVRLPRNAGSYYLTEDFINLDVYTDIAAKTVVNLDLAGHVVEGPGKDGLLYRADGGTINITDSSKEKTGAIIATGEITNMPGRVIYVWGNSSNESCVNLFEGKLAVADGATGKDGVVVRILNGKFNMYGGEITPGICSDVDGSNCIAVGASAKSCVLNVQGGTIKGEIVVNDAAAKITIGGTAKVGIEQPGKAYGIGTSSAVASTFNITYNNVTVDGKVVLKNTDYLSVAVGSTGDERAFTIIDPHNKVIDASGDDGVGELSYTARMCVCGSVDEHTQLGNCAIPTSKWEIWNETISKAMHSNSVRLPRVSGNYYLTGDMILTTYSDIGNATAKSETINLDMAGHTATMPAGKGEGLVLRLSKSSLLNLSDSVGGGKIASLYEGEVNAGVIYLWKESPSVYVYNVALEATKVTAKSNYSEVVHRSNGIGKFAMYGGSIDGNPNASAASIGCNHATNKFAGINLKNVLVDGVNTIKTNW